MECKIKIDYRKVVLTSNDESVTYTKYFDETTGKLIEEKIEKLGIIATFKMNHLNIPEEILGTNVKTGEEFIIAYGSNNKPYVYKNNSETYDMHKDGDFIEELKELRERTRKLFLREGKLYRL